MALPVREQFTYWGIAAAVFVLALWALGDVLLPFILGAAIAYCLDPIADRLEAIGMSRIAATVTITFFAILVFLLAAILVIPTLIQQADELIRAAPQIFQNLQSFLSERFPALLEEGSTLRRSLTDFAEMLRSRGGELANQLLTGVSSLVNVMVLVVLVPVVTFYLLLDWDHIVARIDRLLPRDHAPAIRQIARDIDRTMAGFVRGQGTVCLILGIYYAVALMLVGLNFGLVVGFIAGALTFIPYVGALVGGVLAIGLALFQFWGDWVWIVVVWAIFQSGQFVEGNLLTPKLVGSSVGLHPVTLILALSVFGALFGFVGLLVAVPAAAALGVIVRFLIGKYTESRLYRGLEGRDDDV
ncbi:AI-2E family transporter [Ovoidimarina sediminis]|uniref:AI-2E family transporter n=1 Tax=Ovoidimarina sediminis TaxID=3079856 RepID=UPI00290A9383|nr:AI-2E family transporter [Rhodophyticola sp. MJ-SS7]MDU8945355.1 AI-2E family transporter [Rhodophyticola sp. MJ-SS7]